jgi:hypothetical protein
MSEPLQFSFPKDRLWVLGICLALICLLLFGAGVATGLLVGSKSNIAPVQLKKSANIQKSVPLPESVASTSTAEPETAANLSAQAGPHSRPALSLELAGFTEIGPAKRLAQMLTREGFGTAQTGSYLAQGQTLYYVRLGPYHEWESAARVAGELRRTFNLRSSVLPITAPS